MHEDAEALAEAAEVQMRSDDILTPFWGECLCVRGLEGPGDLCHTLAAMWGFPNVMGFALNAMRPKESCLIASLAIYPFIGIACPTYAGA